MDKPLSVGLRHAFRADVPVIDLIDARMAELQRLADAAQPDKGEQAGDGERLGHLLATLRALRRCKSGNDGNAPQPARGALEGCRHHRSLSPAMPGRRLLG
jgi:hypothetical protein